MDARSSDEEYDFCYSDNLPSDSDDAPPPPTPSSRPGTASEARGSLLISSDDILHVVGARLVESEEAPHDEEYIAQLMSIYESAESRTFGLHAVRISPHAPLPSLADLSCVLADSILWRSYAAVSMCRADHSYRRPNIRAEIERAFPPIHPPGSSVAHRKQTIRLGEHPHLLTNVLADKMLDGSGASSSAGDDASSAGDDASSTGATYRATRMLLDAVRTRLVSKFADGVGLCAAQLRPLLSLALACKALHRLMRPKLIMLNGRAMRHLMAKVVPAFDVPTHQHVASRELSDLFDRLLDDSQLTESQQRGLDRHAGLAARASLIEMVCKRRLSSWDARLLAWTLRREAEAGRRSIWAGTQALTLVCYPEGATARLRELYPKVPSVPSLLRRCGYDDRPPNDRSLALSGVHYGSSGWSCVTFVLVGTAQSMHYIDP